MERKWLILISVSLGSLMATLDGSIVNIALPAIQTDFRIDLTTTEWVVVAYLLVVGGLLLRSRDDSGEPARLRDAEA